MSDVSLTLLDLEKQSQQLALSIKKLSLPKPFSDLRFFDVQCPVFSWQDNEIICQKGRAKLKSKYIKPSYFSFSFSVTDKKSQFKITNVKVAKGTLSISATEKGLNWSISVKSKNLQLKKVQQILADFVDIGDVVDEIAQGRVNMDIKAYGKRNQLSRVNSDIQFSEVSLQANQGNTATESLSLNISLQAKLKKNIWHWENTTRIPKGELYIAPVYVEIKRQDIQLQASGQLNQQGDIKIQQFNAVHADVFKLKSEGAINIRPDFSFDQGHVTASINNIATFSTLYLAPFFEQTPFEGIQFKGSLNAECDIYKTRLSRVLTDFKDFTVEDNKKRLSLDNAAGKVNWSDTPDYLQPSHIRRNKLMIKAIPVESGQFAFLFRQKNIKLLEPSSIPVLGGFMDIKQFNWYRATTDEPKVFFEGGVRELSLEQLSLALGWTPLSGNISGYIPGVDYENKTLKVNGELQVDVFDGVVKINNLASSGMFTDFAKFYMDMEMDNLDLHAITQKFEIGRIEGRVSGFVNNLYLENWEPVTFHAWVGTPDNDDSRHRISQKAVENIASIGGGGAADVISKGFLRFFDTFGYESLGFGCYLHQGVCQLMGVEAAEQGYYIIKGGGLPRIDVIGYNPRVDWNVLLRRLARVFKSDEVVIN